ncbi:MAG: DegT/DnrJ/EryC1/StrS family aminotransferase, partial [Chitinophagales bacterium]
ISACAALCSGTAAIHLALVLLGIERDDIVICPSFTFSATANPIIYQNAAPVFVDSEMETWNMDPDLLRRAVIDCIKKNIRPKAIIVVHLYGMPAKINEIKQVASEFDIPLVEDAAESLGSKYQNKQTGSFGDFGILSFNGNKIITTSGGGALVSENKLMIERAKFLATQARDNAPHYQHSSIGYNYRLSNICAAIGRGQMEVLNNRIEQRRKNFDFYFKTLSKIEGLTFLNEPDGSYSNRWLTTALIDKKITGKSIDDIRVALEKENIESRPLWKPLHLQPVFSHFPSFTNGNSENCFQNGLCFPSGSALCASELEEITATIKNALAH